MAEARKRPAKLTAARTAIAELGQMMARVREARGLSMPQVEKITDRAIERSALSRTESGLRPNPSVTTLLLLCVAYDVDVTFCRDGSVKVNGTNLQRALAALAKETNE